MHSDVHFVTVGGNLPGDRFTEAGVGKGFLTKRLATIPGGGSLATPAITAVPEGNDTKASLQAVVERFPQLGTEAINSDPAERCVIVTDPLHCPRTWLIARGLGMNARCSPARGCPTKFPKPSWWRSIAHEAGGIVVVLAEQLAGEDKAVAIREKLHRFEARIRPSRKARHDELRRQHGHNA